MNENRRTSAVFYFYTIHKPLARLTKWCQLLLNCILMYDSYWVIMQMHPKPLGNRKLKVVMCLKIKVFSLLLFPFLVLIAKNQRLQ